MEENAVELEPYDTEPPRGTPPVRRFRTRISLKRHQFHPQLLPSFIKRKV